MKQEPIGSNPESRKKSRRPIQCFRVRHREPEAVLVTVGAPGTDVPVDAKMTVTPDHSAQVAAPIVVRVADAWKCRHRAESHQGVVGGQIRTLTAARIARHEFPSAFGEETVISARNQLGSIGEPDPPGGLACPPVGKNSCPHVATVMASLDRAVNFVANREFR